MDEVFTTVNIEQNKRYSAWQEAICDVYLKVDVSTRHPENYNGFIREARLGDVTITDTLLSQQQITRQNRHIARLDKDCYYIQFVQRGRIDVEQSGTSLASHSASAAVFCASEPYQLHCHGKVRAFYVEAPRSAFAERFANGRVPVVAAINAGTGLGRIATELCHSVGTNAGALDVTARARIGEELLDVIALALECGPELNAFGGRATQRARLASVKTWIEERLGDPSLSLEKAAKSNSISLRQLHYLFELEGATPADWIWQRRLQRCHDELASGQSGLSVTEIAFRNGFSSSSHFSTSFRRSFGVRPTEVRKSSQTLVANERPANA